MRMFHARNVRITRSWAGAPRAVTADAALRLGHYFGTDPRFWLNLQQSYELRLAKKAIGKTVARLPRLKSASARAD